jgi:hypothetical protein
MRASRVGIDGLLLSDSGYSSRWTLAPLGAFRREPAQREIEFVG